MTMHLSLPAWRPEISRGCLTLYSRTGNPLVTVRPASAEGAAMFEALAALMAAAPDMARALASIENMAITEVCEDRDGYECAPGAPTARWRPLTASELASQMDHIGTRARDARPKLPVPT